MHLALDKLKHRPDFLLVDGNRFHAWREVPFQCMIEGDGRYAHIAAASVLAKTYRDEEMMRMHEQYPIYHWKDNKGYGTARHRQAVLEHGLSPFHRRSFQLKEQQLSLFS
jgi:ribonuclease HII